MSLTLVENKEKKHKHRIKFRTDLPNGINVCGCGATKRTSEKEWHICSLCVPSLAYRKEFRMGKKIRGK